VNRTIVFCALWLVVGCKEEPVEGDFAPRSTGARDAGTASGSETRARDGGAASGSAGGARSGTQPILDAGSPAGSAGGSAPTDSRFDADELYIIGQRMESSCYFGVANIESRDHAVAGLGCDAALDRAQINPATGDLLYFHKNEKAVRAFRCDNGCKEWLASDLGVRDMSNDPIIETPACEQGLELTGFRVSAEGDVHPLCDHDLYFPNGHNSGLGAAVVGHGFMYAVGELVNLADGTSTSLTGFEATGNKLAARTSDTGFLVAFAERNESEPATLWEVDTSGRARKLGTYPSLPAGSVTTGNPVLDVDGAIVQPARNADGDFAFYRRDLNGSGEAEPAFTGTLATVSSQLVTGP
jgi:hypothetical protein